MVEIGFITGVSSHSRGQVVSNLTNGRFAVLPDTTEPQTFIGIFRVVSTGRDRKGKIFYIVEPCLSIELGSYAECIVSALALDKMLNPRYDLYQLTYALESLAVVEFEYQNVVQSAFSALQGKLTWISTQSQPVPLDLVFDKGQYAKVRFAFLYVVTELCAGNSAQFSGLFTHTDSLSV